MVMVGMEVLGGMLAHIYWSLIEKRWDVGEGERNHSSSVGRRSVGAISSTPPHDVLLGVILYI